MRDLTSWESLQPLIGTTSEGTNLDFKEALDPSKGIRGNIEFAKDVAALANVLGGHVLVGVSTEMNATRHELRVRLTVRLYGLACARRLFGSVPDDAS